jgi:AbrB family looped-hinge helix DNA binding protein
MAKKSLTRGKQLPIDAIINLTRTRQDKSTCNTLYSMYNHTSITSNTRENIMSKDSKILGLATVGSKGQIVIPQEAREALQIEEGDKLLILRGNKNTLMLVNHEAVEYLWEKIEAHTSKRASA